MKLSTNMNNWLINKSYTINCFVIFHSQFLQLIISFKIWIPVDMF